MQPYLIALGAGLLAGILYGLIGVRSPAPPIIALVGLLGMLGGEQVVPLVKRMIGGSDVVSFLKTDSARHVLGRLPQNDDCKKG